MKLASFDALVKALDDAHVRYLVAGGLAVNVHGLLRFTKDVDLVIQLAPDNIERAFTALGALGFRPNVPITASQLADRATREGWIREKGMQVLQFWSDGHPETPVDVFVAEPFEDKLIHVPALRRISLPARCNKPVPKHRSKFTDVGQAVVPASLSTDRLVVGGLPTPQVWIQ